MSSIDPPLAASLRHARAAWGMSGGLILLAAASAAPASAAPLAAIQAGATAPPAAVATDDPAADPADPAPAHFQYRMLQAALDTETDPVRRATLLINLNRWRQLPRDPGARYLLVNIPEAVVRLVIDDRVERVHKVIIGKPATPTPRFSASLTGVILNPPWTVPDSIIAESIGALVRTRPKAARAKGYTWSRTASGRLSVVQQPGPGNALGEVKFDMPNPYRVYLHDTPAKTLFAAEQRALSHGCIRIDDALGLAEYLLAGSGWDRARIDATIRTRRPQRIALAAPLRVHVVYLTAFADPAGTVHLMADPYRLDAAKEAA
jgi:murein L,D-transpeptidase YcbB/YkuD